MKKNLAIVLAVIILSACKSTEKTASGNKEKATKAKVACADMHIDMGKEHIDWVKAKPSVLQDDSKLIVLPKVYDVFSIDIVQMNSFFQAVKNNQTTEMLNTVVPLPYGCMIFAIKEQKDMPAPMRKLYPNTIVIKGEKNGYELQMAFDGIKMSGQAKSATQHFNIMPVEANGKYHYIIYEKAQEMEANKEGVYNGEQKMKSLKVRYDR